MERDGRLFFKPFVEIIAFENLLDGYAGTQLYKIGRGELVHPLAVETQLGLLWVENLLQGVDKAVTLIADMLNYAMDQEELPKYVLLETMAGKI